MFPFFKKEPNHDIDTDETPERNGFLKQNLLPLCISAIGFLLLVGYLIKTLISPSQPVHTSQTYDRSVTVAAVGDISLSAKQLRSFHTNADAYDFSNCFHQVAQTVSSADLALGNLEGVVTNDDSRAESNVFPTAFLSALSDCGFDMLQTANSQSIKNGISSIETTKSAIEAQNMLSVGTFRTSEERSSSGGIQIVEINDIRIAVVAFTKGLNNMHLPEGTEYAVNLLYHDYDSEYSSINEEAILSCLDYANAESVDFIIAMVHWGSENATQISETQKRIANLMIDNGVDVIIGSHSHIVSQIEHRITTREDGTRKDAYIAYSLGDFLTSSEQSRSQYGCILNLCFEKNSQTGFCAITDISYTPTYCTSPSKTHGTTQYAVIDSLNAIQLRKEQYIDSISESLSEILQKTVDALAEQTESDYLAKKPFLE